MFNKTQILIARTIEVLGNEQDAIHWLETSKRALGNKVPIDIANTEEGYQEVLALLARIEYGVFS